MASHERPDRILIAHIVHRFSMGGLENGVANLINRLPDDRWRHAIIALTDVSAEFSKRVKRQDVVYESLHKISGHGARLYPRMYRLIRSLQPDIVHTRNLAALEMVVPAWAARVPVRIHGEHGRDMMDLDGSSRRYQWVRRLYGGFVTHYVALSKELAHYLDAKVGIAPHRIEQIYNGVDTTRFAPAGVQRAPIAGCPFGSPGHWLIGTVGRLEQVKDQANLARAFVRLLERAPALRDRLRLLIVGEGRCRPEIESVLRSGDALPLTWMPGERKDIPAVLRGLDCFVLPSLGEGISNTILEAMASGLAVVATDVGGNSELIQHGLGGTVVPPGNPDAIASAVMSYVADESLRARHGRAARERVEAHFSIDRMVSQYANLYERTIQSSTSRRAHLESSDRRLC